MSVGVQRSALKAGRPHSLFYRDLGLSPATHTSSPSVGADVGSPNQVTAALWRANDGGGSDPPPPPFYTLEDRIERSPEANANLFFDATTPQFTERNGRNVLLSPGGGGSRNLSSEENQDRQGFSTPGQENKSSEASSWWSPRRDGRSGSGEAADLDGSAPMSGVLQQQQSGRLLTLQAPGEIVRPEFLAGSASDAGADGEGWVTVFGLIQLERMMIRFGVDETNSVMREFEKCGRIVNHVSGPSGANWVHLQYLNPYDAQKALMKNGIQLNGALIVGVKRLDPLQIQGLTDNVERSRFSFAALPARTPTRSTTKGSGKLSALPHYLQPGDGGSPASRPLSEIASPAKSTLSKLVDLVFGM